MSLVREIALRIRSWLAASRPGVSLNPQIASPSETFPEMGTVANPAILYDGADAFLCYEVSPRAGGGNVVLKFSQVIDLHLTPMNVGGTSGRRYLIKPWDFSEVIDGEETVRWKALNARFWLISFNDVTVEILFETVSMVGRDDGDRNQQEALLNILAGRE